MLCDQYKEALIEAAANSSAPSGAAGEHVRACVQCTEYLAAQETLFVMLDSQLRETANANVPRHFEQRVLSAMGKESLQKKRALLPLFGFAAMAVAAALALAVVRTPDRNREVRPGQPDEASIKAPVSAEKPPAESSEMEPPQPRLSAHVLQRPKSTFGHSGADVLVPAGQQEILAKYMDGIAARQQRVTLSASLQHEPEMKAAEVSPLENASKTVTPLADLGSD